MPRLSDQATFAFSLAPGWPSFTGIVSTVTGLKLLTNCLWQRLIAASSVMTFSMVCPLSIQTFPETPDRPGEDHDAEDGQRDVLRPEDVQPHPLEKDAADDDQKIAQRVQVCPPLNDLGHVRDREAAAGE